MSMLQTVYCEEPYPCYIFKSFFTFSELYFSFGGVDDISHPNSLLLAPVLCPFN